MISYRPHVRDCEQSSNDLCFSSECCPLSLPPASHSNCVGHNTDIDGRWEIANPMCHKGIKRSLYLHYYASVLSVLPELFAAIFFWFRLIFHSTALLLPVYILEYCLEPSSCSRDQPSLKHCARSTPVLNHQYTSYQQRKEQSNQPHSTDRRQSSLAPTPLPKHPPTPTPKDRLRHFLLTLFAVNHPPLHLLETHYYSAFFLLLFFFFFFF